MHTSSFDIESILRKDKTKEEGKDRKSGLASESPALNISSSNRRPLLLPRAEPIQWSAFLYNLPYSGLSSCNHCGDDSSHIYPSPWLQYGHHFMQSGKSVSQ